VTPWSRLPGLSAFTNVITSREAARNAVKGIEDYAGVDEVIGALRREVRVIKRVASVAPFEAFGRVSAREVVASRDVPPFDTSHMDGFAVRWQDVAGQEGGERRKFRIVGTSSLGARPPEVIGRIEAVRVSTGSKLPVGADTVVPLEDARVTGSVLTVEGRVKPGQFVYRSGEDVKRGERIIRRGHVLRAQDVARLISLGVMEVSVFERPRVAVIATGSELTNSPRPKPWQVVNSHGPMFVRLVERAGCLPVDMGIVPDSSDELERTLREALRSCDAVLTTGGTSVGERDITESAISSLSPSVLYHGVRMDRGRVTGVAVVKGKPIVFMPGPVQGAMNAYALFALPVMRRLSGCAEEELTVTARLSEGWEARRRFSNFTKVLYVSLEMRRDGLAARPVVGETESMRVLTDSDGLVVVPESITKIERGAEVKVTLLPGFSFP
jgi:molybdopterin molybdotransferase